MLTEIRTYRIAAGRREEFLRHFHANVAPLQRSKGITIVGPFCDVEDGDTIVWFRSFPSLDDRERLLKAFYESAEWNGGLKETTGNMVQNISWVLVLLPESIVSDLVSA